MSARRAGIIALVLCAWASTIAVAVPQSLDVRSPPASGEQSRNPLVGVWRFEGEVDTQADGTVVSRATAKEKHGFIVYMADKFVSANIMPSKRSWLLDSATRNELVASADDGTAYAGRYEIDTRTRTVTHILGVSFEPAYENRRLVRRFALSGDRLALTGTYWSKGRKFNFTVHLQRNSPAEPAP